MKIRNQLQAAEKSLVDAQDHVAAKAELADYLGSEKEDVRADDALQHVEQQQQAVQG